LIAEMIRKGLAGEAIEVFGEGRRRTVHYAPDLAKMIEAMARLEFTGFVPINLPGRHVTIADLASRIASCTGGTISQKPVPADVAAIDTGDVALDCALFEKYLGPPQLTALAEAIKTTIAYARAELGSAIDGAHPA
jgi:nucleoside-diphosphate-sugar epimerase